MSRVGDGGATLFAGVDRALLLVSLVDRLRAAGLPVALTSTARAVAALSAIVGTEPDPASPPGSLAMALDDLYWVTRLSLVTDRSHLAVFDAVFAAVFCPEREWPAAERRRGSDHLPPARGDRHVPLRTGSESGTAAGDGLPWAIRPSIAADDDDGDEKDGLDLPELLAVSVPGSGDRPFDDLDAVELAEVCRLVEQWRAKRPTRTGRRRRSAASGRLELRSALRRAGRTGGDPVELPRSRTRRRDRSVALLIDVSASMESYARVYLHLARALVTSGPTEVFALSTESVRLTTALRIRSVDAAMDRATTLTDDRFGGTRLATAIGMILNHQTWSGALRGAIVVIVSDGWDTDPPELLERRMARLARLGHRLVWVNPRSAAVDYQPLVGGMAAALPHCDRFLSGHSLDALADVLAAVTDGR